MNHFRVGVVGCGEASQILHLPSLHQLADKFSVTALCDVSGAVLNGVGDHWRVSKRFLDYRELVRQPDVDVVLICNPNAHHAEVTLAAVEAGKHVLVEKPMCMTLRENDAISAAQHKAGVIVQVGQMRRYAPAFVQACQLVREMPNICLARVHDVIGKNALIIGPTSRVFRGNDIPSDVAAASAALQNQRLLEAIGEAPPEIRTAYMVLIGLSTHDISAMRELIGMPQRILYAAQRWGGLYMSAAFDYGSFVCQFETGIDDIPRFDAHLEVYGSDRVVRVDYDTPYIRNLPIRLVVTRASDGGVITSSDHPGWGDAFAIEWEALYDNIVAGKAPKTSPDDFRHDLELFINMIALMRQ